MYLKISYPKVFKRRAIFPPVFGYPCSIVTVEPPCCRPGEILKNSLICIYSSFFMLPAYSLLYHIPRAGIGIARRASRCSCLTKRWAPSSGAGAPKSTRFGPCPGPASTFSSPALRAEAVVAGAVAQSRTERGSLVSCRRYRQCCGSVSVYF
jgi:hypothetical protein